jgi:hypothetical protein
MTLQEIFDKVSAHLLTQNAKSMDDGICSYRGQNGRMCAAGRLIKDEFYASAFEGRTSRSKAVVKALVASGVFDWSEVSLVRPDSENFEGHKLDLVCSLQILHDDDRPAYWPSRLRVLARRYDLTFKEPK